MINLNFPSKYYEKKKAVDAIRYMVHNTRQVEGFTTCGFAQTFAPNKTDDHGRLVSVQRDVPTVPVHVGDWIVRGEDSLYVLNDYDFHQEFVSA